MLDRETLTPDHWVYIPEEHIAVHRISEFTNFSRDCAPPGKTMVCAEITSTNGDKYWTMEDDDLIKLAAENLAELKLLDPSELKDGGFVRRVDYAYPIYDLTYRGHVRTLIEYLRTFSNMVLHWTAGSVSLRQHGPLCRDGSCRRPAYP